MNKEQLKTILESGFPGSTIIVNGDDGVHFEAIIVSEQFLGISRVKQQQLVYNIVGDAIRTGVLHALALKTYTPDQWKDLTAGEK